MDYVSRKKSYSDEYYYINKITGKTQLGFNTYFNTNKQLPRGWVRLNLHGKPVYKYNKPVLRNSYSYAYSPREFDIFQLSYEDLDLLNEEEEAEAYRRYNLFQKVARFLKLTTESICDESLEFLAEQTKIPVERIITYINETESKQLGKRAISTLFSRIKRTDSYFSSKRSIRELCGVNTREIEAQNAFSQIEHQFTCIISQNSFIDPVTCSSGHTFEREYITRLIRSSNPVCPFTRLRLTGLIEPNHSLKKVIDQFIKKYINQKGEHWAPILQFCVAYIEGTSVRLKAPIDVSLDPEPTSTPVEYSESDSGESRMEDSDIDETRIEERSRTSSYEEPDYSEETRRHHELLTRTGRTEEEIREYLISVGYNIRDIENIPEVIAQSINSSYSNAIREVTIRFNALLMRMEREDMRSSGRR